MPFDSYANLKTSIGDFLNRRDLTATIPDFIVLAEARFNRWLRTIDSLNRAITQVSTQFTQLPDDFRDAKTLKLRVNGREMAFDCLTPAQMIQRLADRGTATGQPDAYTIVGRSIEVSPVPDATYLIEMAYFRQVPTLTDAVPSNWLLVKHPDIYLYGALLQSAPYLKEDERLPTWQTFYDQAQEEIRVEDERSSHAGATPRMRARSIG